MKQFKETLNTAVFTTKFVMEKSELITSIFHYEDGSWQFSGHQKNLSDSDYRIISLGQAIKLDNTITEVADMPTGYVAFRDDKNSNWKISPFIE